MKMYLYYNIITIITILCINNTYSSITFNKYKPTYQPTLLPTSYPTKSPTINDPQLLTFDFNSRQGNITLYFNSYINISTFYIPGLTLLLHGNYDNETVRKEIKFVNSYYKIKSFINITYSLYFYISSSIYAEIIYYNMIYNGSLQSMRLAIDRGTILSLDGYMNEAINYNISSNNISEGIKMNSYIPDSNSPYVTSFDFNMNYGYINITFNKPINRYTFTLDGLALQSIKNYNYISNTYYYQLISNDSKYLNNSNYGRTITYSIGDINLNTIKSYVYLCNSNTSCYLSGYKSFVNDTNSNPVSLIAFDALNGLKISNYSSDSNNPILYSWVFNMNDGFITLNFSETIYTALFNYSGLYLVSESSTNLSTLSNTSYLQINQPFQSNITNTYLFSIYLTALQLDFLNTYQTICYNFISDCYLVLLPNSVVDTSLIGNYNTGNNTSFYNPLELTNYVIDTNELYLISYTIDLTNQLIVLYFSKIINVHNIHINKLSIQSDNNFLLDIESIILSNDYFTIQSTSNSNQLVIFMNNYIYNYVMYTYKYLLKSQQYVYLSMLTNFVYDTNYYPNTNQLISKSNAFIVNKYVPDNNIPRLIYWTIDLSNNYIQFTFNKVLNISIITFDYTIYLCNELNMYNNINKVYLLDSEIISSNVNSLGEYYVVLSLHQSFKYQLIEKSVCVSIETCYINIDSSFSRSISTYVNNTAVYNFIESVSNHIVKLLEFDTVPPNLISSYVNLSNLKLYLSFDKVMNSPNVNVSIGIFFNSKQTNNYYNLSNGGYSIDETNTMNITIYIGYIDYFYFQRNYYRYIDSSIYLSSYLTTDISNNYINKSTNTLYFTNQTNPNLIILAINMNNKTDILDIYFNSNIYANKIDLTNAYLVSNKTIYSTKISLSNYFITNNFISNYLSFNLSGYLTNHIGKSQSTSYLYMKSTNIITYPNNGTTSIDISLSNAIRDGNKIVSFSINMSSKHLIIESAYKVDTFISINPTAIQLKSNDHVLTLSNPIYIQPLSRSHNFHIIYLNDEDYIRIQSYFTPIRSSNVSMNIINTNALIDSHNKYLSNTISDLVCNSIYPDRDSPEISYYTINLNTGTLDIYYNEIVNIKSFVISKYSLLSNDNVTLCLANATYTYTSINKDYYTQSITISLLSNDYKDSYVYKDLIYINNFYSFKLLVNDFSIVDTSYNYLQSIDESTNFKPEKVVYDTTPPQLVSFNLDLNNKYISMTFTKLMNVTSFKPSYYKLINNPVNLPTYSLSLTNGSVIASYNTSYGYGLNYHLSDSDIKTLQQLSPHLCYSTANCYLSFQYNAITDLSTFPNSILTTYNRYAINSLKVLPDLSKPKIIKFIANLMDSYITIYFDKLMNCYLSNIQNVILQSKQFIGSLSIDYQLTTSSSYYCNSAYTNHIKINLGDIDLLHIQSFDLLYKNKSSSYLRVLADSFFDSYNNSINTILDGQAIAASTYFFDTVKPKLVSFVITTNSLLYLVFNKPMNKNSLLIDYIVLQNRISIPTYRYILIHASLLKVFNYNRQFILELHEDYPNIYTKSDMLKYQNSIYLYKLNNQVIIMDTYNNDLEFNQPLQTGPSLYNWDLNMNNGVITLEFTEYVHVNFTIKNIVIFALTANESTNFYNLTTDVLVKPLDELINYGSKRFSCLLSDYDRNQLAIKNITNHVTKKLYVYLPFGLTYSSQLDTTIYPSKLHSIIMNENNTISNRYYTSDTTNPTIYSFDLDFNYNRIIIYFDKTLDLTTINITSISVASSKTGQSVRLTNYQSVQLINQVDLYIYVCLNDLYNLKYLYISSKLDLLYIDNDFIKDYYNNNYLGSSVNYPISIKSFIPDTSIPNIKNVVVDYNNSRINIYLNEQIILNQFSITNFSINSSNYTSTYISNHPKYSISTFEFSSYTLVLPSYSIETTINLDRSLSNNIGDMIVLDMSIIPIDLYRLQSFSMYNTTLYLSITGYISDLNGNINYISNHSINDIIYDSSSVKILNLDYYIYNDLPFLTLHFSSLVNLSSVSCSNIIVYSNDSIVTSNYVSNLFSDSCIVLTIQPNSYYISLMIKKDLSSYFLTNNNIYVSIINHKLIKDKYMNELSESNFIPNGPTIRNWLINMNNGLIEIIFSSYLCNAQEYIVNNIEGLGIYIVDQSINVRFLSNNISINTKYLPSFISSNRIVTNTSLSTDSIYHTNYTVLYIYLHESDLNRLKFNRISNNIYLLFSYDNIVDRYNQSVRKYTSNSKNSVSYFLSDNQSPYIVDSTIDLGNELIIFQFNEPIVESSIYITHFTIQSNKQLSNESVTLDSSNSYSVTYNSNNITTYLIIELSLSVASYIKLSNNLCKNLSTSFISIKYHALYDFNYNYLSGINSSNAIMFSNYLIDTIDPTITSFSLDMTNRLLTIQFSEPVIISNFTYSCIYLQSRYTRASGVYYQLSNNNHIYNQTNNNYISITLSNEDFLSIEYVSGLARSLRSTYLTTTCSIATDLSYNPVENVLDGAALLCSNYITSSVVPTIKYISLDLYYGIITFNMSQPIDLSSVKPNQLSFMINQSNSVNAINVMTNHSIVITESNYTLTALSSVSITSTYSSIVYVNIKSIDLLNIKLLYYLIKDNQKDYYIKFTKNFLSNSLSIYLSSGSSYINDVITNSVLTNIIIYSLDLSNNVIKLYFSEPVDISTANLSNIYIQSVNIRRYSNYTTLMNSTTSYDLTESLYYTVMNIYLSDDVVDYMKYNYLGYNNYSSYLSITNTFIADYAGNYVAAIWDGSVLNNTPITPNNFTSDVIPPQLIRWYNHDEMIYLIFDEPIFLNMNPSDIVIHTLDYQLSYQLSTSISFTYNDYNTNITFDLSQCTDSCINVNLLDTNDKLYININANTFIDFSENSNSNQLIVDFIEGTTYCSNCSSGYYVSSICTGQSDRACSKCSTCPNGSFIQANCSAYDDIHCQICSPCPFGYYIKSSCSKYSDTVCEPCDSCNSLQYVIRECAEGLNSICGSCEKCVFEDKREKELCYKGGQLHYWIQKNCCYDIDGNLKPCEMLAKENEYIEARNEQVYLSKQNNEL